MSLPSARSYDDRQWIGRCGHIVLPQGGRSRIVEQVLYDILTGVPALSRRMRTVGLALPLLLLAACGGGGGGGGSGQEAPPLLTVSGTLQYEFVPPSLNCRGLDFNATTLRPVRGATVQLIDAASGSVIGSTISASDGAYSFAGIGTNRLVHLRVRAELKQPGSPSWDVEIRDNVVDPTDPNPPPLGSRPLYVLDGTDFDTGSVDVTRNLTATTGWGTNSYTGDRAAAPFAILDTIYSAIQFVLSADPTATFAPLDVFWSVNNTSAESGDIDSGALGTSFYRSDLDSLFLLGDENDDTEEFDDHVILHEWGHYFADNFSRSDSLGGHHALGERIDARLAFGEGWASALAAMALSDPVFCDTGPAGTNGGLTFNVESSNFGVQGWFNEISIVSFIYDLWDTNDEGGDPGSIGFAPIYNTMTGPQRFTEAFTTVFSFATELRASLSPADQAFLDSQLDRENIVSAGLDIWGSNESNDANARPDVLPVYTDIVPDGTPLRICSNAHSDQRVDADDNRERYGNKLSEYRYLRMNVTTQSAYALSMVTVDPVSAPPDGFDCSDPANVDDPNIHMHSDPDISVWQAGQLVGLGFSCEANSEAGSTNTLSAGTYVLDIREFRYADPDSPQDFPEQTCFDVRVSSFP